MRSGPTQQFCPTQTSCFYFWLFQTFAFLSVPLSSPRSATASQRLMEENVSPSVVTGFQPQFTSGSTWPSRIKEKFRLYLDLGAASPGATPLLHAASFQRPGLSSSRRSSPMVSFHGGKRPVRGSGTRWRAGPAAPGPSRPYSTKTLAGGRKGALEVRVHVKKEWPLGPAGHAGKSGSRTAMGTSGRASGE